MKQHVFCTLLILIFCSFAVVYSYHSIDDYGGVPNVNNNSAARQNSIALQNAFLAANSSSDKTVLVPSNNDYFIFDVQVYNVDNITFQIDGNLIASNNITAWPKPNDVNHTLAVFYLNNTRNFVMTGNGTFDGQGYDWWVKVFLTTIDQRPHLVVIQVSENVTITNLLFKNSPQYHILAQNIKDFFVADIRIIVDVEKQKELYRKFDMFELVNDIEIPVFPLNTDGIDPSGTNVLIENVYIENFDDAVAVKPTNANGVFSKCSENMVIRNSVVAFGVGLTIGSVPPSEMNCVRNILFENITMHHPIKAIYIKTNPGNSGDGIIENITYRNINGDLPLWYPMWIGPQQQRQPGSAGTGCSFFYPIIDKCPTQPRVPIRNITLENIKFREGLTLPGVILCDPKVPCSGFNFTNVDNHGFFIVQKDYVCKNVVDSYSSNNNPSVGCF